MLVNETRLPATPASDATDAEATSPQKITQPRRKFQHLLRGYVGTDVLALVVGPLCAWGVAYVINHDLLARDLPSFVDNARLWSLLPLSAGLLLWFQYRGHYRVRMNFWAEAKAVISALLVAMMLDGFTQFAAKNDFSRLWLMSGWLFSAVAIIGLRVAYRAALRRRGVWAVPTLLIGGGLTAADTRAALASEVGMGYAITATITNLPEAFLKSARSWEQLCADHGADYVVVALDGAELDQAVHAIAQLTRESVPFSISSPRRNLPVLDMAPQYFFSHDIKLLTYSSNLEQPWSRLIKRSFDVVVSATALLALSPVMLWAAFRVTHDGGPAFFGHPRIGRNGRIFKCLKFRSMIINSQEVLAQHLAANPEARAEWEADHKLKNDPRVTKFGDFLRRSSLDELPQLINVLKGDMSLVGPRPIVTAEIEKYEGDIAHYYRVRPGITGLWQVSGRNDVTYEQRVRMDSWYVRNWSLWHDVAILAKTIPALLKRSGAY